MRLSRLPGTKLGRELFFVHVLALSRQTFCAFHWAASIHHAAAARGRQPASSNLPNCWRHRTSGRTHHLVYNAARTFLPARTPASQLSTLPWLSECDRRARRRARHCGSFQRPSFRVNYSRLLTGKKIVKRNAPAMRRYLTLRRPAYCEEPLTLLSENGQSLIFQSSCFHVRVCRKSRASDSHAAFVTEGQCVGKIDKHAR